MSCSVRFVPDQRPDDLVAKLRAHMEEEFAQLHSKNSVSVKVKSVGDWWEADPKSKLFRLAENALHKVATALALRSAKDDTCCSRSHAFCAPEMGYLWGRPTSLHEAEYAYT